MPWKISFDEQTRIVETTYTGLIGDAELREVALATLVVGREHSTGLYLGDCLDLEHAGSLFNVYDLVRFFESLPVERTIKEAILLPAAPNASNDLKFYETAALNRGYNVRVFNERAAAVRWLLEK
jgi:hypothetical protein